MDLHFTTFQKLQRPLFELHNSLFHLSKKGINKMDSATPFKQQNMENSFVANILTPEEITEEDLPLLANVNEVKVHHYLIKLCPNFDLRSMKATLIVFLEWINCDKKENKIILDSCFLNIKHVYTLKSTEEYDAVTNLTQFNERTGNRKYFYKGNPDIDWFAGDEKELEELRCSVSKWSTTISGWKLNPSVIRIDYETLPTSPSLHWRPCSGEGYGRASGSYGGRINRCAYTPAPPVNNRGLFICQEPPSATATWEALIEVDNFFTPLLTSDEQGEIAVKGETVSVHYFYTSIPLPISTFAIIIGHCRLHTTLTLPEQLSLPSQNYDAKHFSNDNHCQNHELYPCRFGNPLKQQQKIIPVRLFSFDEKCIPLVNPDDFSRLVSSSLTSSWGTLGPHPFDRLDFVIMPRSFPHLGLASPSMTFLSPSIFSGHNELLFVCRITHEICHSWFGLLIGALDWTEEWLSEGFATFCEDIIAKQIFRQYFPNKSEKECENELSLKICLRFISLQNELRVTNREFHVMSRNESLKNMQEAKNGLVPITQFMTVHYIKGYLLLRYLSGLVKEENFLEFLKEYVYKYHGQLVTSNIFLNCFYEKFKDCLSDEIKPNFIEKIRALWLESEPLPSPFDFNALEVLYNCNDKDLIKYPLFENATVPLIKVRTIFRKLKLRTFQLIDLKCLTCNELLFLFELVLNLKDRKVFNTCSRQLLSIYDLVDKENYNIDVMHKWCEVIVACKDLAKLYVVEQFLETNIAMGIYLYGELMITERASFQKLAKDMYFKLEHLYDLNTKKMLNEMLF